MRHRMDILPRKLANPINLPGLAAVRRVRLFHARRIMRNVEPDAAHQNCPALKALLMIKLPALAAEPAYDGRCIERAVIEIDEIDAPLPRRGIVKAQRLRFNAKLFVGAGHVE